jgi:hypothetical protein
LTLSVILNVSFFIIIAYNPVFIIQVASSKASVIVSSFKGQERKISETRLEVTSDRRFWIQ